MGNVHEPQPQRQIANQNRISASGTLAVDRKGGILDHSVLGFYESLAAHYHLIFEDWNRAVDRQAKVLNQLLKVHFQDRSLKILDCACGIGTQALGFAKSGHTVTASDLSEAAVLRARDEARNQCLDISFVVSDMTSLSEIVTNDFDVVAAMDNALPHLSHDQLPQALRAAASKLTPNGRLIASIRDYDELLNQDQLCNNPPFMEVPEHDASFIRSGIGLMRPDMSFIFTSPSNRITRGRRIISSLNIVASCVASYPGNWSLLALET